MYFISEPNKDAANKSDLSNLWIDSIRSIASAVNHSLEMYLAFYCYHIWDWWAGFHPVGLRGNARDTFVTFTQVKWGFLIVICNRNWSAPLHALPHSLSTYFSLQSNPTDFNYYSCVQFVVLHVSLGDFLHLIDEIVSQSLILFAVNNER